jgi:hypothetical protein
MFIYSKSKVIMFLYSKSKVTMFFYSKSKVIHFNSKINMESKTFARTSARRYRIVDAEERLC